jgi:hypothetical protein
MLQMRYIYLCQDTTLPPVTKDLYVNTVAIYLQKALNTLAKNRVPAAVASVASSEGYADSGTAAVPSQAATTPATTTPPPATRILSPATDTPSISPPAVVAAKDEAIHSARSSPSAVIVAFHPGPLGEGSQQQDQQQQQQPTTSNDSDGPAGPVVIDISADDFQPLA